MEFGYLQLKTRHYTILLDKLSEEQNLGHQVNVIRRPCSNSEKSWSKFLILVMCSLLVSDVISVHDHM